MNLKLSSLFFKTQGLVIFFISLFILHSLRGAELKDGDIIFQTSNSQQCKAVAAATHSPYTHMGIIFVENDQAYVYEAVEPVCKTALKDWIYRGVGHHYVIKRLQSRDQISAADMNKVKAEVSKQLGKHYDLLFSWSDEQIYCSELVWKGYERGLGIKVGELRHLREFDLSSPIVQEVMRQRYGTNIPKEEWVISPADMFASDQLVEVQKQ